MVDALFTSVPPNFLLTGDKLVLRRKSFSCCQTFRVFFFRFSRSIAFQLIDEGQQYFIHLQDGNPSAKGDPQGALCQNKL